MPIPSRILSDVQPRDVNMKVIAGKMPTDISGEVFLSQPNPRYKGQHAFFGDGVLSRLSLSPGMHGAGADEFAFRTSQLQTPSHRLRKRHPEQFHAGMLGINSPFGYTNSANTAQVKWGDRLLVTWDAGRPVEVDPLTLEYLQEVGHYKSWGTMNPHPALPMICTPAHFVVDPDRDCVWTCDYNPMTKGLAVVRYDQGKEVQRWPLTGATITQTVHTMSQTENWIVIVDNGYRPDMGELAGQPRSVTTLKTAPVYLIRKDLLDAAPNGSEVKPEVFSVTPETMHFYADYDDSDGVKVLFEHSTDSDIAMSIQPGDKDCLGRPLDEALTGMYGLAQTAPTVSLMRFDPATGEQSRLAEYQDPERMWNVQTSAKDWCRAALKKPTLHHVMYFGWKPEGITERQVELYKDRVDRSKWPSEEQPCCLFSFDWRNDLKPKSAYQWQLDELATTPSFAPRNAGAGEDAYTGSDPGGHDGYVVVPVVRDDGFRVDILDAARVGDGPVASLAAEGHFTGFMIHSCWMPHAKRAPNVERLRLSDELSDRRLARLPAEMQQSVREVAAEIDEELDGRA